ncbi:10241_t:CDS:2, partial [Scutellospora calospora]
YKYRKLTLREAINFISDAWDERATRIMPEASEPNEYREEDEQEESMLENDVISEVDDVDMLVEDLSVENYSEVQELKSNIEEYAYLIDQLVITEDVLTDEGIIEMATEALEKVIKFQESLEVRKGFNEQELKVLRKKFKEWRYERDKNKKQLSILSFL